MKILIIGNADSIWVKNYYEHVLKETNSKVFILTPSNSIFAQYYGENNVIIQQLRGNKKIYCARTICRGFQEYEFDFIHVQYGSRFNTRTAFLMKKYAKQIIVSFWGSDIFRLSAVQKIELSLYLWRVNKIVVLTHSMYDALKSSFCLKRYCKRVIVQDFGASLLDDINCIKESDISFFKQKYGIPDKSIVIGIGYNKSEGQQHNKVMNAIVSSLSSSILDKLFFVFQMTYGSCSKQYLEDLTKTMQDNKINYVILDSFLDDHEVAVLRKSIDIYINAQITDALAATINEYLYSGAIVFNPVWLNYDELDSSGVYYNSYDSIESLPKALRSELDRLQTDLLVSKKNKALIWRQYSWRAVKQKWICLYD